MSEVQGLKAPVAAPPPSAISTSSGTATDPASGAGQDPLKGETPVVQDTKIEITVPFPKSRQEVELLLAQYLTLTDSEDDVQVKEKIEDILAEISDKQEKINEQIRSFESKAAALGETKDVNFELLQKQILGAQLLSHDINLPEPLQEEFLELEHDDEASNGFDEKIDLRSSLFESVDRQNIQKTSDAAGNSVVEDIISNKISTRINQLERISAQLGSYDVQNIQNALKAPDQPIDGIDDLKIRALIELKGLNLLPRQKFIRRKIAENIIERSHFTDDVLKTNPVVRSAQRSVHRKPKVFAIQTARLAEQLEEQQKKEISKKEAHKAAVAVEKIIEFADDNLNQREDASARRSNLGRSLQHLHQKIEKEESKKLENTAKARLQALKANDEEAYLKLLDQTKDTRITHLLRQTNSFLDSLANAVREQQNEAKGIAAAATAKSEEEINEEREKIDYYEVAHLVKEEVTKQPSILTGGTLKEYQLKGLQWMVSLYNNHLNGILADEMGLGKTIQSISLITYLYEIKKETGKFLVIVPLSTITNWTLEFEKWAPTLKTIVYKGSPPVRKTLQHEIRSGNFTVLLTTYEYIIKDRPLLAKFRWAHMIIDEGHRMKNSKSKLSSTLTQYYHTKNRLILTGTPLQNNLPELWALLNFVLPKIFNSVKSFDEWFNTPFANTGTQDKMELTEEESLLVIRRLHKVLRPFLLRRLKKDVEKDLPDKVEKVVKCKLSALQYVLYQQMLKHNAFFVGQGAEGASKSGIKGLNNKIMQLRKICNHPYVFEEVENVINPHRLTNDSIWRSSGKFELLDRVLPKFKASGHRVLMFFQMTQVMDIMEDFLRFRDMKYLRLDGGTKADDRQDMLKEFNAPNSEYFAFLLSTRAGGLGLNLQTADTVIIFDTDWNPHQDLQAQDRAHRIGQKNEVRILRLISDDSVEEVILERAHQKLDIDGKVIQAGKFDNKSTSQEQEEFLRKLLEAEQSKTSEEEEDEEMEDEALNEVLARNDDEKILFAQIDEERNARQAKVKEYKSRLMQEDELPSVFTEDISIHLEQQTVDLGRTREKKRVFYDDGLTEEQWLDAMDNDEDSVEAAIQRKRARTEKRRAKMDEHTRNRNDRADSEEFETIETPPPSTPNETPEPTSATSSRKRRAAAVASSRSAKKFVIDDDDDDDDAVDAEDDEDEDGYPDFVSKALQMIDEMDEMTDPEDGHYLTGIFQTLPSRKEYPDYYQIIAKPISISVIAKNLKKLNYESWDEILTDFHRMFENAKTYNGDESVIFQDAVKLDQFVQDYN